MVCRFHPSSVDRAGPWRHHAPPLWIVGVLSDVYVDQQRGGIKITELDEGHVPVVNGEKGDGGGHLGSPSRRLRSDRV